MRSAAIVLALWLILASAVPARSEPVSIAVLSALAIEATATAIAVTTFVLTTAASIGISYLQMALSKKPTAPELAIGGSSGKLAGGGTVPRAFGVGTYMTAGSLTYANTYGDLGKTPNAVFVQEMALSDIPVAGLVEIWVNGAKVTYDPESPPGNFGITIPEFTVGGIAHLWVRFYDGTQTAADPLMVELFGSHPERPYSDRRIGRGVAKVAIFALVNPELFSGFPQFKFVLQGAKLYDRRHDDTAGGSGDQRRDDPATWTFTENPAVIRENIIRGIRYDGAWQYGGQTVGEAQLPAASWFAAANECDAPIALAAGGTEPQFRAGGEITFNTPPADVLEALNKADNGRLAEIGGVYKTRSGAAGAAVFAFTDRDILTSSAKTFDPFAEMSGQINHVTARHLSPEEGWNFKDAPALVDLDLEALDGRRLSASANYGFVTLGTQVQRLMLAERDTARAWRRHALPMPPDAFVLEPLDVVVWTSDRNGYDAKTFEIVSGEDLPNLNMGFALKELDPSAYDWDAEVQERPIIDGTIAVLRPPPQPIIAWFADPYVLTVGGRSRAAILFGWDAAVDDVDGIRFEVRVADTLEIALAGEEGEPVFAAGSLIVSHNLLPATQYQARGQYRPASPRTVQWSSWLPVTTPDVRITARELAAEVAQFYRDVNNRFQAIEDFIGGVIGEQDAHQYRGNLITARQSVERDETLTLNLNSASATISEHRELVVALEGSLASLTTTVTATFGSHQAQITTNATSISGLTGSLASLSSSVTATFGSHQAQITSNATSISNLSGSFSTFQTSTTASIGSLSASVTTNATAIATVDGKLAASWGVTVDGGGRAVSLKLLSNGTTAAMKFSATDFVWSLVGFPDKGLTLGNIGGSATFGIGANMLIDGSITVHTIAVGAVTAGAIAAQQVDTAALAINGVSFDKILAGAVGQRASYNTAFGSGNILNGVSFTVMSASRPIRLTLNLGNATNVSGVGWASGGTPPQWRIHFYLDGVLKHTLAFSANTLSGGNWAYLDGVQTFYDYDAMSVGAHTFTVVADNTAYGTVQLPAGRAIIEELAK